MGRTATDADSPTTSRTHAGPSRTPQPSSPVLLHPLPSTLTLTSESKACSELELDRQTRQIQRERELAEALQEREWELQREAFRENNGVGSWVSAAKGKASGAGGVTIGFKIPPQAYELYKAIDGHDIDFIMRVRDHAFALLLQKHGGEIPIIYAGRIGPSHRDIVILLIGAFSRYVNHLEEQDFEKKETKGLLKALRSNLKIAIDTTLLPSGSNPSSLLSSYLQVLLMSEGDAFLHKASYDISLILRDSSPGAKPVTAAEGVLRRFCTKELRGVQGGVMDVEEYVANGAGDLVMMAAWSIAAQQMDGMIEGLPTHTFARDLRMWTMLKEAMEANRGQLYKVNKRIRGILDVLLELGGDTRKGVRGRLRDIRHAIEGEE